MFGIDRLKDGHYYLVKVKALYGNGSYEDVWKYNGVHKCFFHNGAVFRTNNKRFEIIKEVDK